MNLHQLLAQRAEDGNPVGVALIGAGKFGTMFLAQARLTTGLKVAGIADLDVEGAKAACARAGWPDEQYGAGDLAGAGVQGPTLIGDDVDALLANPSVEVVIEATGNPHAGIGHCLKAIGNGKHIVMVNVEADVVAGPLLAR